MDLKGKKSATEDEKKRRGEKKAGRFFCLSGLSMPLVLSSFSLCSWRGKSRLGVKVFNQREGEEGR